MIHNPLPYEIERVVMLPLYYAGLSDSALIREREANLKPYALDRQQRAFVPLKIPANGRTWLIVEH